MRAVVIDGSFGLENLRIVEREEPEPGPGQVRLAMRAASLNFRDLLTIRGHYNPRQPLPLVPCSDGVGEVVAVGAGVKRVSVGDRVMPIFAQEWLHGEPGPRALRSTLGGPRDGTLAEQMVVDAEGVVPVPEYLSDEEAACLPCAAVTAWTALVTRGGLTAGDTVLVQGTGGVSVFALQIAVAAGARVIVTSSSDAKLERAMALGAWKGINYVDNPEWGVTVAKETGGVDHVIEVGGAGTLAQSLKAVRTGGQISVIGVLSGTSTELDVIPVLMRCVRLQGIFVGHRASFEAMNRALEAAQIRPVVDRVFELDDTRSALEHMAAGAHFGKVCLRVG